MDNMNVICDKCGSAMNDVRAVKTNPKGPDFKCSKADCKFNKNRATGAWEPSQYKTAKWMTDVATDTVSGAPGAPQANMTPEPVDPIPPTVTQAPTYHTGPRTVSAGVAEPTDKDEMWKRRGEQMNRSNLAAAFLQSGQPLTEEAKNKLSAVENWVLERKFIPF